MASTNFWIEFLKGIASNRVNIIHAGSRRIIARFFLTKSFRKYAKHGLNLFQVVLKT